MKAKGKRYDSDQWMYDAHVRPVFGRTLLQEISPYALDRFMASLTAQGLSAQTIRHFGRPDPQDHAQNGCLGPV